MRSSILISRMARLMETAGTSGNGASLASDYAEAVRKVNERLEGVVAAADAKVISDAIRLLSEDPPLLDEASTLDFYQFADWESLCDMRSWTKPPKIDRNLLERAVEIGETKDAIAPFLSMYKKSIRVNNVRLSVKSLRRLADLDKTQDWTGKLRQSEGQLQQKLVEEFDAAKENVEERDRLAQELLDGVWLEPLAGKGADRVKAYRDEREAEKRNVLGRENLSILKKCRDEKWDRKLAFSMVQAIDALVEKGWKIPEDEAELVGMCRQRCANEFEAEEKELQWKELNEKLHAAIQREDCAAIRDVLSAPVFLDRDPDAGLLGEAQAVLNHAEVARRRKTLQIAVCSFLAIAAVVGVSAWWLRQKIFTNRCEDEAMRLANIERQYKEKPSHAIATMAEALKRLAVESPEIHAHPKVEAYEARLKALIAENNARTNQIDAAVVKLEGLEASGWPADADATSVKALFDEVTRQVVNEDVGYRQRLATVRSSWLDHQDRLKEEARESAIRFQAPLVSHMKSIAARLRSELAKDELQREVDNCKAALDEWRKLHSKNAEDLDAELIGVEKEFNEAIAQQQNYREALDALVNASGAVETLEARQILVDYHGNYPEVKHLVPLPVGVDQVKSVLAGKSPEQMALHNGGGELSQEDFKNFLKENVLIIPESPEYYSLYGLLVKGDARFFALSKGRPEITKKSYEKRTTVAKDGRGLLSYGEQRMVNEMKGREREEVLRPVLMPSAAEMQTVVDIANRQNLTVGQFEVELLKLIQGHVKAAHEAGYVDAEEKLVQMSRPTKGWYSPYCRVQFISLYVRWLKEDLKVWPKGMMSGFLSQLDDLAQPITIDDEVGDLAWACLWADRIRRRTIECAKLLNRLPVDWASSYRKMREFDRELGEIAAWTVLYAGKVKFDPLDPKTGKAWSSVYVQAPQVNNDHPLYVLRKRGGSLCLVRAFEKGRNHPWRLCRALEKFVPQYVLGEPLYHVQSKGRFIDVQQALEDVANRYGIKADDERIAGIPLFGKGDR